MVGRHAGGLGGMKPQHIQALGGGTLFESYAGALPREQMLSGSAGKLGASAVALGAGWKAVERGLRVAATARVLSIQIEVEDAVLEILFHSLEWRGVHNGFGFVCRSNSSISKRVAATNCRGTNDGHCPRGSHGRMLIWRRITDGFGLPGTLSEGGTGGSACIEIGTGRQ